MSRANVASAFARSDACRNFVASHLVTPSRRLIGQARTAIPARLPSAIIPTRPKLATVLLLLGSVTCLLLLVSVPLALCYRAQDRILAGATRNLDLMATVIADSLDLRLEQDPAARTNVILAQLMEGHTLGRGQEVLVSDATGTIIAAHPVQHGSSTVADHLGTGQPLTIFAERAGVMKVVQPNGREVLATVHSLHARPGQVVLLQGLDDILCDWRTRIVNTAVLLVMVVLAIVLLAAAYLRQAARTRRADRSCRVMSDRIDMVLSSGRCGLWDWDLANDRIEWSLSMFDILGLSPRPEALTCAEVDALIHSTDGGLRAVMAELTTGRQQAADCVFRMRTAAGAWIWLRAKAEMVTGKNGQQHVVGVAIDITETMVLEERTATADLRLRDALETVSEAFVLWDAENRLVMCNSKFQRFHNLPPDAVRVGTPYAQVMERGTPPLIHSQVALGERQPFGARTFEAQLGDGRWLQINERRTKDGGYVSVGTDITALKRHEEQLIESERRLMNTVIDLKKSRQTLQTQAQQLTELADKYLDQKADAETANRAKSDFLANMGHELRTPLNAILGFSEIMSLEAFGKLGASQYLEYSQHIHSSGQYLLTMIADVLEMSRLEAGRVRLDKEEFAIGDAVTPALAAVAGFADQGRVMLTAEAQPDMRLHADRTAVEKILTILLNNAVKYTGPEGRVVLRGRSLGDGLQFCIEDTGVGMPPDAVERLGRPFTQLTQPLKNGMRGSGLGLAIARSLVELHGGSMRIESEENVGTTVLVHLPNAIKPARLVQQVTSGNVRPMARITHSGMKPIGRREPGISRRA